MRKQFLSMMAIAGITLLASCSNDEIVPAIDNGSNGVESEITLALSSGGSGLETRAGRPVNSSAAANSVDKVQLKLYKKNTGTSSWEEATSVKITGADIDNNNILTWSGPTGEGVPGTSSREEKQTIKLKELSEGDYKIIAYGYQTDHGYTSSTFTENTTDGGYFTTPQITYAAGDNGTNVEELFAGSTDFQADSKGKITTTKVEVKMHRQLAGMIGYFRNIPVKKLNEKGEATAVRYVKVKTVAQANKFKFPSVESFNGVSQATGDYTLLTYDLSTIIGSVDYNQQVSDAKEDLTKTFTIAARAEVPVTVENSIFAGRFIVPFSAAVDQNTLRVVLEDESNNELRSWNIKINTTTGGDNPGNTLKYNIERNKFYSIGQKIRADKTGDPDTPGKDPDTPVDLNNDNDIIVILNDAWDVIYNMGLED